MKLSFLMFGLLLVSSLNSCKKDKGGSEDGETEIVTLEVTHVNAEGVYGRKYTFKLQFNEIGNVTEYGIVYKPWIGDKQNKTPSIGDSESFKLPFAAVPPGVGTIQTKESTMRFSDFNDANYRAYAVTGSGEIVYGEVLYISFT